MIWCYPYLNLMSANCKHESESSTTEDSDPEPIISPEKSLLDEASYLDKFFFNWSFKFIKTAKERRISRKDMGRLRESEHIELKLEEMKSHYKGDLIKALLHTFKWEYASSFTFGCV